ncbi:hypothetical protein V6Z15_17690, partial [Leptospira borgpetersenii]|uniref:hypothetical protein n=1 Tax=Leptospira borgpetersenii TaxID=174 RepID=UPI003B83C4D4
RKRSFESGTLVFCFIKKIKLVTKVSRFYWGARETQQILPDGSESITASFLRTSPSMAQCCQFKKKD